MQIAFYGIARGIGTSANMAAVAAGMVGYFKIQNLRSDRQSALKAADGQWILTDCGRCKDAADVIASCDLLALNISIPDQGLEEVYFRHSLVRKNVIFLIGKYYQDSPNELKQLAYRYRIPLERICVIPYHPGFAYAYDQDAVTKALPGIHKRAKSRLDWEFEQHVKRAASAVITYGKRKGEQIYG